MADELAVWLYGMRVAVMNRERGRPRLAHTEEAATPRCQWPIGTAQWRPAELPAGGHENCPPADTSSAAC